VAPNWPECEGDCSLSSSVEKAIHRALLHCFSSPIELHDVVLKHWGNFIFISIYVYTKKNTYTYNYINTFLTPLKRNTENI
jgi:hypothetical protein